MKNITKHRKTFIGLVRHIRQKQVQRGRHQISYTSDELLEWCNKNSKFKQLYNTWVKANYVFNLRPTIDRIDVLKSYSLKNIQPLSYEENIRKGNRELLKSKGKKVIQIDLNGKIIAKFNSLKEAAEKTGFNSSSICNALKGRVQTYKLYKWIYGEHKL